MSLRGLASWLRCTLGRASRVWRTWSLKGTVDDNKSNHKNALWHAFSIHVRERVGKFLQQGRRGQVKWWRVCYHCQDKGRSTDTLNDDFIMSRCDMVPDDWPVYTDVLKYYSVTSQTPYTSQQPSNVPAVSAKRLNTSTWSENLVPQGD